MNHKTFPSQLHSLSLLIFFLALCKNHEAHFLCFYFTGFTYFTMGLDRIIFEWADIIFEVSKAKHLERSVSLVLTYLFRQLAL